MKLNKRHIIPSLDKLFYMVRNADTRVKILLPALLFLVLPYTTLLIIGNMAYFDRMDENVTITTDTRFEQIKDNIELVGQKASAMSKLLASMEEVNKAYKAYYNDTVPSLDASMMLQYSINGVFKQLRRDYDNEYKFHFFVPPANTFLRSWNSKRLDDLSSLKNGVLAVNRKKETLTGIEAGPNGLMIRGISPIFSKLDGTYFGAVETMIPLKEVISEVNFSNDEEFALYAHSTELENAGNEEQSEGTQKLANNHTSESGNIQARNNYVVANYTSEEFKFDKIKDFDISGFISSDKEKQHFRENIYNYAVYRIKNINNQSLGVVILQNNISNFLASNNQMLRNELLILLGYLILALIVLLFVTSVIFKPLQNMMLFMDDLNQGKIYKELHVNSLDQLGKLQNKINTFVASLREMVAFSQKIIKGEFESHFKPLGKNDYLGNSLMQLRDNLKQAKEEEATRQEEDIKRNWANEGKTLINEAIRRHTNNLDDLADSSIKTLIDYLKANQGGLYVAEDNKEGRKVLNLRALYAYNYKRYEHSTFEMGEGLLGMAAQDKLTVYRTNIPEYFVRIRSGLGEAPPTTLIIVPLVFEGEVYGAVELASFSEYQDYQIQFIEEVGETIASAIAGLLNSRQTERLLEQSRRQTSELEAKEEEMRKNLERVQKAEKEAKETEERTFGIVNAFNKVIMRANFAFNGYLKYANPLFLSQMHYLELEVEGFSIFNFLPYKTHDKEYIAFNEKWEQLKKDGTSFVHEAPYKSRNSTLWLHGIFSAIKNANNEVQEILFIGFDIDKDRRANLYFEQEGQAINQAVIKTVYKPDGTIVFDNAQLQDRLGYVRESKEKQTVFDLMESSKEKEHFRDIWDKLLGDEIRENIEMVKDKADNPVWFKGVYTPVKNETGNIEYIVFLGIDITEIINNTDNKNFIPDYLK